LISPATDAQPRLAVGWRMWVASGVIMLCSWLSYVDRRMLAESGLHLTNADDMGDGAKQAVALARG